MAPAGGTLVAYAAEEGKTAADGDGRNSPYTGALLAYLEEPGLDVGRLFRKVRAEVVRETGGAQKPFEYGALPEEDVFLGSGAAPPPGDETSPATASPSPSSGDAARAYEAAERLNTVAGYRAFIRRFPGSFEAELAQGHIDKLEEKPKPIVVAGGDPEDDVSPAAPPSEEVERGLGLSREERRLVQMGLASAGYAPGPADGVFGKRTREALGAWQASKGLEVTGYLTKEQSEGLVALGREEAERRRAEAERKAREAEERRKRARKPGDKFQDCPGCPEMAVVPGGQFGRPFAVGVYEVTFGEWDACESGGGCGGYRPSDEGWGRGRRPVMNVSWNDAKAYVGWLSRKTGEKYRLLSDAEWEYVARAGTTTHFWWGDGVGRNRANCTGCGSRWDGKRTAPVGSFSANPFGLHDVHGNVWEWVEDCDEGDCSRRVLRGGSGDSAPRLLRSAFRVGYTTGLRLNVIGFRIARTLTP